MSDEKRENNGSENSDVEDVDSGAEDAAAVTIPKKRGRPAKGGVKVEKVPSGRGRGRPAKAAAAADGSDSDAAVENGKKAVAGSRGRPPKAKGRGRPKAAVKRVAEEEEEEDEEEEEIVDEVEVVKKKLGRPPTGAASLNIQRTGKGVGRPSNAKLERQRVRDAAEASGEIPKRAGRPARTVASVEEDEDEDDEDELVEEKEELNSVKKPPIKQAKLAAA